MSSSCSAAAAAATSLSLDTTWIVSKYFYDDDTIINERRGSLYVCSVWENVMKKKRNNNGNMDDNDDDGNDDGNGGDSDTPSDVDVPICVCSGKEAWKGSLSYVAVKKASHRCRLAVMNYVRYSRYAFTVASSKYVPCNEERAHDESDISVALTLSWPCEEECVLSWRLVNARATLVLGTVSLQRVAEPVVTVESLLAYLTSRYKQEQKKLTTLKTKHFKLVDRTKQFENTLKSLSTEPAALEATLFQKFSMFLNAQKAQIKSLFERVNELENELRRSTSSYISESAGSSRRGKGCVSNARESQQLDLQPSCTVGCSSSMNSIVGTSGSFIVPTSCSSAKMSPPLLCYDSVRNEPVRVAAETVLDRERLRASQCIGSQSSSQVVASLGEPQHTGKRLAVDSDESEELADIVTNESSNESDSDGIMPFLHSSAPKRLKLGSSATTGSQPLSIPEAAPVARSRRARNK